MVRLRISLLALALAGCAPTPPAGTATAPAAAPTSEHYDLVIRNGVVYDGSGAAPKQVDVAIRGDRVVALLPAGSKAAATQTVDAHGQAVAPGFINVLSWAVESLIADGRGMSDTKQGVTLEIFGEGWSMGPLQRAHEGRCAEAARRHPLSDRMDHARRLPRVPGEARRHPERRLLRRRDHGAHP